MTQSHVTDQPMAPQGRVKERYQRHDMTFRTNPFVQWSGTICAILVEGIMRNNSVKLF